jgi:hypothetical protein
MRSKYVENDHFWKNGTLLLLLQKMVIFLLIFTFIFVCKFKLYNSYLFQSVASNHNAETMSKHILLHALRVSAMDKLQGKMK